jgi:hypothetical protein
MSKPNRSQSRQIPSKAILADLSKIKKMQKQLLQGTQLNKYPSSIDKRVQFEASESLFVWA